MLVDDEELIKRSQAGDEQAFAELIKLHEGRIFSLLMRQIGVRAVAHDLAQNVFLRIYRGLPAFRGEATFTTWTTRITLNVINSYYVSREHRKAKRTVGFAELKSEIAHCTDLQAAESALNTLAESPAAMDGETTSVDELEAARMRLRSAVATLPEKYRQAITLTSFESKSYEEAAEILNIPVGTIRSRLNYARKLLRAALREF